MELSKNPLSKLFRLIVVFLGVYLVYDLASHLLVEVLWFLEVQHLPVFLKRFQTQLVVWVIVGGISGFYLLGNILLARRNKYFQPQKINREVKANLVLSERLINEEERGNYQGRMNLILLLPLVVGISILIALMLLHLSKEAVVFWQPDLTLPSVTPLLPEPFELAQAPQLWQQLSEHIWQVGFLVVAVILLLINTEFWLGAIAVGFSLLFGLILSGNWAKILLFFNPTIFNEKDPVFGLDISFEVFRLPFWQLADFWLGAMFLSAFLAVLLIYILSANSISEGKFPGFNRPQLRHLYALGSTVMLAQALRHWLSRYELLYSRRGVNYGASFTDINVQLPVETTFTVICGAIAFWLLFRAIVSFRIKRTTLVPLYALGFYAIAAVLFCFLLPAAIQRLEVQPNELELERPYIERSITFTRAAFALNDIEAKTFDPRGQLSAADIEENELTIENIRLWDTRPLLQTNRQLQRIRLYYEFPDADIDRYRIQRESRTQPDIIESEKQQVIIAARELNYAAVPQEAQTWINKHLIYTHGYGFTLSPVNQVGEGGLPDYFVKDIGTGADEGEEGILNTSSDLIRRSIPIGKPRIYYGELTNTYVMTSTKVKEFDFPSGEDNVYNTYDGTGGIEIGSIWRRLIFAEYLKDWRMLFTDNFTSQTRLLFRRNINERVRAIAPFLRYDRDPYLVTAKTGDDNYWIPPNYLYWIIDAYTTSNYYPYSDPGKNEFNYIRNSVKIVIDAYDGDIDFYVADPDDPIINTWSKIFPNTFKPLTEMPVTLLRHIRYPLDLFSVQSERLLIYHMRDPQVFYNREDQWQIPEEIYGTESQPIEPYYLIMKLPTETSEEFILLHPYTPTQRNNLIAWLAGRSDGENYGKLLLYQFPKQKLVYGPEQIEALINQDPVISQRISLWNRQGSRAIQGNLLVIPIEQSLLYVEPLYLEAEENSLPTLVRVIVVYENRIIMAETLEEALEGIFAPQPSEAPTIIRDLEGIAPTVEEQEGIGD
ncbi:UPF0182 family protein [Oscillatoria salina]|uniref:UPF0182 family protein n=1 Tax=Oscillatoria salina TaxID=331517 RepID=UPI0013B9A430|nr:UPF0182 family protein [Oscillatoria salina]MBZ8180394.1 UPF0182 family protein [Oscillatoria salina IIICB1]NET89697.1 UPF0182 family protein [Kamptonema sp. SIO1D9]